MGLLDKVKAQAGQVAAQGQAKLGEVQAKRQADALLRELGHAYFKQQREGGSAEAVSDALAKVDAHVAEHGSPDAATSAAPAQGAAPAGDFKLDDL